MCDLRLQRALISSIKKVFICLVQNMMMTGAEDHIACQQIAHPGFLFFIFFLFECFHPKLEPNLEMFKI